MMNFKKLNIVAILIVFLISCSDTSEQETQVTVEKPKPKTDHALKGYQDQLQKAKDMEKEILKAAELKKKAIDDATK